MTPPPHAYFAAGDTSVGFTPCSGEEPIVWVTRSRQDRGYVLAAQPEAALRRAFTSIGPW
jgi:hypothetical protein